MNTSPYDNLPVGNQKKAENTDLTQESKDTLEYVEIPFDDEHTDHTEAVIQENTSLQISAEQQISREQKSAAEQEEAETQESEYEQKPAQKQETSQGLSEKQQTSQKPPQSSIQEPEADTSGFIEAFPSNQAIPADNSSYTKLSPMDNSPVYEKLLIKNRFTTGEYVLPFEETLLVPDTMPDIEKI